MQIVDHKKFLLLHWIWFEIEIENIWKKIKCFVNLQVIIFFFQLKKFINLLLKIFWLYSVNVVISIRNFKIEIEDSNQNEIIL